MISTAYAAGEASAAAGASLVVLFLFIAAYLLPTIVALFRGHRNTLGVFFVNLFLGWTMAGWVAALVWSVLAHEKA